MKRLSLLSVTLLALGTSPALAQKLTFDTAVESVRAEIEPAKAKPGQTVTYRLIVKLTPGHHTYPTVQPDKKVTARNTIQLPDPGDLIFVEPVADPPGGKKKPAGGGGTETYYEDGATWEIKAVVSPKATPGAKTVPLKKVKIQVCRENNCLAPRPVDVAADFEVAGEPVAVERKYKEDVEKALGTGAPPPKPEPKDVPRSPKEDTPPPRKPAEPKDPVPPAKEPDSGPAEGPTSVANRLTADRDYAADLKAVRDQLPPPDEVGVGFWQFLATAAAFGFLTLLTPCVFPMVPITVSIFVKQGEREGSSPLALALVYAVTIVVLLSVAALTLLTTFSRLSVHPVTNVLLGGLFVVLALSLFGLFELTLPTSLSNAVSNRAGQGGYLGTVFMAMSFTIVSFTCVAPFLGGFSGMAASGKFSQTQLVAGAVTFATAFASPFFLLALFPSLIKKLPRSGDWMNMVKVTMGFLELAAALKFFRTAELRWLSPPQYFTYDMVLALWVAILAAMGLYLLGMFKMKHDHEEHDHVGPFRILLALAAFGVAIHFLPALFGSGPRERNRPAGVVYAWVDAFLLPEPSAAEVVGSDLPWSGDLRRALDNARARNGRVFVDFTGKTCSNCKLNEREVFPKPEVRDLFKQYTLVQLYTDEVPPTFYESDPGLTRREADATANFEFEKKAFGQEQLPLYVILKPEPNGKTTVVGVYDEGKINNEGKFVEFLKNGLK